ncbi:biosynthetic peptidoglycan transglycosylase [Piscinibacter sp.]|uniref:biosynthetic peptidoglycan transglycosylase n=1 Tax=Piscinibacter sp. TaxID=1903157 RepID=UPI0039E2D73B
MRALPKFMAGALAALLLAAVLLAALAWHALAPRPGEWAMALRVWKFERQASVPTLLRWATHPLALPWLDGRRFGDWQVHTEGEGAHRLAARCAPCRVRLGGLGSQPVVIDEARLSIDIRGADRFDGTLRLGRGERPATLAWRAELQHDGLGVHAELPATPLARVLAAFEASIPELRQAQVQGSVALGLEGRLDAAGWRVTKLRPTLADIAVAGLGTEALRDVDVAQRCRPQPDGGRIEGWIQNAVIAAEDQRFFEHPGYELDAWVAVLKANQRVDSRSGGLLQGASTITQQLAKLLYTGDERDAARKLREWLYAVEMERTLGKGRILQLYLALLPWGDGVCGAEAAARHHLGKSANRLKPREAAWLASLLVNPDQQLRRWGADEAGARERAAWVLKGIRRLPRERREAELDALVAWRPPVGRVDR